MPRVSGGKRLCVAVLCVPFRSPIRLCLTAVRRANLSATASSFFSSERDAAFAHGARHMIS